MFKTIKYENVKNTFNLHLCISYKQGFAMRSGVCALCRQPIPNNFIKDPTNYVKSSIQISNEDEPKFV